MLTINIIGGTIRIDIVNVADSVYKRALLQGMQGIADEAMRLANATNESEAKNAVLAALGLARLCLHCNKPI